MKCIVSGYGVALDTSLASFGERAIPMWTDGIESPSFLAYGDDYLFAITENSYYASLYAYRRETVASYRMTDRRGFEGRALCHIAYSEKNRMLLGACYESGTVVYAAFDPESGKFGDVKSIAQEGEGVSRQHCVLLNAAEDRVYTANLGLDRIYVYRIEAGELVEETMFSVREGSGPRHMRLSLDEKLLYIITEYSNEILIYDTQDWSLKQAVSTLPEGYVGASHCSTLCFSPDHRFLYAANRYADTIAVFDVDEAGLLTYKDMFDCGGRSPRHMEMAPDGTQLVICCQDSDWVVFKRLNKETGLPSSTVRELPILAPACVVFVP